MVGLMAEKRAVLMAAVMADQRAAQLAVDWVYC